MRQENKKRRSAWGAFLFVRQSRQTVSVRDLTPINLCGWPSMRQTHTIYKYKLREMLPSNLRLVSGQGSPVCVTPIEYIDKAIFLTLEKGVSIYFW